MSGHVSSPGTSSNAAPVLEKQAIMAWTGIALEADGPDPCGLARLGSQNRRELGPRDALCCPPPSPRRRAEICLCAVGPCGLSRPGFSSGRWRHHRLPCSDSRNFHLKSHCPASFDSYLCLFPGVMRNLQTAACTPRPPKPHASLRGEKPRRGLESSSLPPARLVLPQHRPLTPAPSPGAMGRAQSSSLGRRYLCLFVCLCVHASAVIRLLARALRLCACACTCVCVRAHACACMCTRAAPSPLPTSARWSRGSPHQRPPPGRRRCPRRKTPSPAARVTSWQETRPLARQVRPGRPGRVWLERTVLRLSTDLAATLRSDSPAQGSRAHGERAESTLILRGESEEGSACHLGLTMLKPQWGGGRAGEVSSLHVKKRDRTLEGPKPCSGPHS